MKEKGKEPKSRAEGGLQDHRTLGEARPGTGLLGRTRKAPQSVLAAEAPAANPVISAVGRARKRRPPHTRLTTAPKDRHGNAGHHTHTHTHTSDHSTRDRTQTSSRSTSLLLDQLPWGLSLSPSSPGWEPTILGARTTCRMSPFTTSSGTKQPSRIPFPYSLKWEGKTNSETSRMSTTQTAKARQFTVLAGSPSSPAPCPCRQCWYLSWAPAISPALHRQVCPMGLTPQPRLSVTHSKDRLPLNQQCTLALGCWQGQAFPRTHSST